jgi:hypothetical protein
METYEESSLAAPVNHSSLFNSMIHPFTRMVIYGSIWYQGKNTELQKYPLILFIQVNPMLVKVVMLVHSQK